jgi:butyrate kinase
MARLSGAAMLQRQSLSHALNSKAVAKRYAGEQGKAYDALRLIVAHLGSGISVSAHQNGRMIDATNSREEGAFSTERAGGVPAMQLLDLCFAGKYTKKQIETMLCLDGGLQSYLGTKDLAEVENLIAAGDEFATTVFNAMAYQIAKEIGGMAAALSGRVDAILLTGGMAHSERLVVVLTAYLEWIAPIVLYPGEDELQALAEGALRVLRGEEQALKYGALHRASDPLAAALASAASK